ncbi:MAG: hypothetical protein IPM01_26070 [Burkholderiaceae bacterium]|nr:hypothetical protein [Burkholderiaceae bacterium]
MQALRAHVLLEQGVLRMQGVEASVAGGRISGSTRLEARQQPARWAADLRFAKIDVAGWIRALEAPGAAGGSRSGARELRQQRDAARRGGAQPVRAYLTGELSGTIRVAGTGRSTAEILGSIDGQARFALGAGTLSHLVTELAGLDLAQALGVWVRGDRAAAAAALCPRAPGQPGGHGSAAPGRLGQPGQHDVRCRPGQSEGRIPGLAGRRQTQGLFAAVAAHPAERRGHSRRAQSRHPGRGTGGQAAGRRRAGSDRDSGGGPAAADRSGVRRVGRPLRDVAGMSGQ